MSTCVCECYYCPFHPRNCCGAGTVVQPAEIEGVSRKIPRNKVSKATYRSQLGGLIQTFLSVYIIRPNTIAANIGAARYVWAFFIALDGEDVVGEGAVNTITIEMVGEEVVEVVELLPVVLVEEVVGGWVVVAVVEEEVVLSVDEVVNDAVVEVDELVTGGGAWIWPVATPLYVATESSSGWGHGLNCYAKETRSALLGPGLMIMTIPALQ